MTPQEQLEKFYESWKAHAPRNVPDFADMAGPDLIWLDEQYLNSRQRIAIIGKEQRGWDYTYPEFLSKWSVSKAIDVYLDFDLGKEYYASPFWQFFHGVRLAAFPEEPEARRKVLWSNLVKFVSVDESPISWKPYGEEALAIQKGILPAELSIAKPDVCIFVTGPGYDEILESYYPQLRFEALELPVRQFAKLVHHDLPQKSFRCYHPNYLNRDRKQRWDKVFEILSRELAWSNK